MNTSQVYILRCSDWTYYTWSTNNIKKRIHEHNNLKSGAHYTKIRRPVEIIYTEIFETLNEARKRECEIKKLTRGEKDELINHKF